jgi:hypothetical protein
MKTGKTAFNLMLVFLALVFLFSFPQTSGSKATFQTVVRVDPATSSADLNGTFTVNITVADVQNLYGLEVNVYWNATVLEVLNVDVRVGQTDGALCSKVYIVDNSTAVGKYSLAAMSVAPAPAFNGTGLIVRITFHVKNHGNSPLDLNSQLYDFPPPDRDPRISLPIEHDTQRGLFEEVIPEITNLPLFPILTAFTATVLLLILRKHRKLKSQAYEKNINDREV